MKANIGMAHCLNPFGDFIDERIWLTHGTKIKTSAYLREFENRDRSAASRAVDGRIRACLRQAIG
jgi:hypothetical protein